MARKLCPKLCPKLLLRSERSERVFREGWTATDCQGGRGDCQGEGDDARSEALGGDAANVVEQARLGCAVTRRKGSSSCGTVHVQSSSQYARTHAYFTTKTWPRQNLPLRRTLSLFIVVARDHLLMKTREPTASAIYCVHAARSRLLSSCCLLIS